MVKFPKRLGTTALEASPVSHHSTLLSVLCVLLLLKLVLNFFFCFLLLSRGEDVTEFQPPPDYILMADCIYYEEVSEDFAKPVWKSSLGRARVSSEKYSSQYCACVWVPIV